MTRVQIETNRVNIGNMMTDLSNAAIDAITNLEAITEELNTANESLVVANTEIAGMRDRIRLLEASTVAPPIQEVATPTAPITENYLRYPNDLDVNKVVRFLSKTSSGGLANIRASLNDMGVNAKRLRLEGSTYTPNNETLVINWGGGFETPSNLSGFTGRTLNKLTAVKIAANKLKTFEALKANPELARSIPGFTVDTGDAAHWPTTYCRGTLYGHSGEGITVRHRGSATRTPSCPLYVEGLNIKHEYRVHVVNGFTKIQKKARLGDESCDMEIRNNAGGWTFVNQFTMGERGRSELHDLSVSAIECIGLDFGAVDIIRTQENEWKILEINTAPGVTAESNIEWYSKALLSI